MEIEVKYSDDSFINAMVKSISSEWIEVSYADGWKSDEKVDYTKCRIVNVADPKENASDEAMNFVVGDEIEAHFKQSKSGNVRCWKNAKILEIKGPFAIVEALGEMSQVEIIPYDLLRSTESTTPLTFEMFRQLIVGIDADLLEYLKKPESFDIFISTIGNIHVELNEPDRCFIVWSYSEKLINRAKVLKDFFISDSKRKLSMLQRKEQMNSWEANPENLPRYSESFLVDYDLVGLVIGRHGINLMNARKIQGIRQIELDQIDETTPACIKILSDTYDAIVQARAILEFAFAKIKVPRGLTGKIIGRNGSKIQKIVNKSGVIRVCINDLLENADYVEFVFTGTKETVSMAEILMNYQLKHNLEMDELREKIIDSDKKSRPNVLFVSFGSSSRRGRKNRSNIAIFWQGGKGNLKKNDRSKFL